MTFFAIYWWAKYGGEPFPSWNTASDLLAYSLSRTIPLIIPAIPKLAEFKLDYIGSFSSAMLVGVHALLSGALLFLLLLGLRNRFRLKS